jgi:uncharacterized protein YjlB
MDTKVVQTEVFADDGKFPNSLFPVIIYKNVFPKHKSGMADEMEALFAEHNWTNSWRDGIYNYHHYHSTAHEVLGISGGMVKLHLGGEQGRVFSLEAGDVVVIPAGVAHKNVHDSGLEVVGAYYEGRIWDVLKGEPGERPEADENIFALPAPELDPVFGSRGVPDHWNDLAVAGIF